MSQALVRGLYAGLSPALVGSTAAWGVYFSCYNRAKVGRRRLTVSTSVLKVPMVPALETKM